MGKEVKRVRINSLSTENGIFEEIIFHDGINLILGEKCDDSRITGRKTNGVGKSICIELIDFCFLNEYDKSRISRIPIEVLPLNENVILNLDVDDVRLIIKRNRQEPDRPVFIHNDVTVQFNKLYDARYYLKELIFCELSTTEVPSVRSLLSILIRDERSEFKNIIKCHDLSKRIPDDLTVHLYMLGISLDNYKKALDITRDIESNNEHLKQAKKELTENGEKKIGDIKADMNNQQAELDNIEKAIDSFRTNEAYISVEGELNELENRLNHLRREKSILNKEYKNIMSLPKPEEVDDLDIEAIYNHFKAGLGNEIVRSLNEVVFFKNKVEKFQRVLINQKALELRDNIEEISSKIRKLDDEYAKKARIIDEKGTLKNLKNGIKIYGEKKDSYTRTKFLYDQYDQSEKRKRKLDIDKKLTLLDIDGDIKEAEGEISSFANTIYDIHDSVMGNRRCSFEIKANTSRSTKTPVSISLRISEDGSHSIDRTKVFIYDVALMFNEYTRERHPLFLVHDNIFDVDQDTLVQCLNYLYHQENIYTDFQYILTLNRDKIENEENKKQILMDIDSHKVATFTKDKKFFAKDYQEK